MLKLMEEDQIDFSRGPKMAECFPWKKLAALTAAPRKNIAKQQAADGKDYTYFQTLWELQSCKIIGLTVHSNS